MPEKILSICIPTYNRADILDKTLSELVLEPSFKLGKVEICISDNASPDHTESIVKKYTNKYNNILYNRNKENTVIIDGNFPIVAAMASGTFIKFLNDYAYFTTGALDEIIEFIKANKREKPVLFFSNNCLLNKSDKIIQCNSLDMFVQSASYWTTWVLCAGFWRRDFNSINDRDRSIAKFMWCPDNYLRLVSSGRKAIIYNRKFCNLLSLSTKGGYNVFRTFGLNYLDLYKEYIESDLLNIRIYNIEKYKLFKNYIIPMAGNYLSLNGTKYTFDTDGCFRILFKNYWHYSYFYIGLIKLRIIRIVNIPIIQKVRYFKKQNHLLNLF